MPAQKLSKTTILKRIKPGRMKCGVKGCHQPYGNRYEGFTKQGLTNHTNKLHAGLDDHGTKGHVEMQTNFHAEEVDELSKVQYLEKIDQGTPGDEVIMGPHTTFMDDVKYLVDPISIPRQSEMPNPFGTLKTSTAPVVPSTDEGSGWVQIRARNGKLYVDQGDGWEEMDVDKFCTFVRFAVRVS